MSYQADTEVRPAPAVVARRRGDSLKVELLSPAIGAEVTNFNMLDAIEDDALVAELRALLLQHKVIVFRDQDITSEQHVRFSRRFGELEVNPFLDQHPEFPELVTLYKSAEKRGTENSYHSDVT